MEGRSNDGGVETAPWHSALGRNYHTETACIHGQRVGAENRRAGTGEKLHCEQCKRLERRRRLREARERRGN